MSDTLKQFGTVKADGTIVNASPTSETAPKVVNATWASAVGGLTVGGALSYLVVQLAGHYGISLDPAVISVLITAAISAVGALWMGRVTPPAGFKEKYFMEGHNNEIEPPELYKVSADELKDIVHEYLQALAPQIATAVMKEMTGPVEQSEVGVPGPKPWHPPAQ